MRAIHNKISTHKRGTKRKREKKEEDWRAEMNVNWTDSCTDSIQSIRFEESTEKNLLPFWSLAANAQRIMRVNINKDEWNANMDHYTSIFATQSSETSVLLSFSFRNRNTLSAIPDIVDGRPCRLVPIHFAMEVTG